MGLISYDCKGSMRVLQILSLSIVLKAVSPQLNALINSRGIYRLTTLIAINKSGNNRSPKLDFDPEVWYNRCRNHCCFN